MTENPKFIAQGLANTWEEMGHESKRKPLEDFLRYNYQERYVALCVRIGKEPVSFAKWLQKLIDEV